MKKLQEKSIEIFANGIYGKVEKAKSLKREYDGLIDDLKALDNKIDYHRRNDDYAEVTRLKRQQKALEDKIEVLDNRLKEEDYSILEDDYIRFYEAFDKELEPIKAEHEKLRKEMKDKIKELGEVYERMIINKNNAGRRISRKQYVDCTKTDFKPVYKGQILANEVQIGGNTTPHAYRNLVMSELKAASLKDYQAYYYNEKQW
ncbi:hypothetical protein [Mammaliicoccus sciuri]|uniref:hypothetical protein n=1 Tax=Mammaliicoccus sciuri TaxID=1296 RepID=UPI001E3E9E80|nr:hypothetical protein [Mammaliicoccus sciuri]MCD8795319.1 hypothetical protein [Mammaliicoccus sciuri]